MADSLVSLLSVLLLILLHALITIAYAALTNSKESFLREQTESGDDVPPRLHITYQLSLLLLKFIIAALAISAVGDSLLAELRIEDPNTERLVNYIVILLPTALITLIIGDLAAEGIGSTRADRIAPFAVYPMRLLIILLSPLVSLMIALSKLLASAFGSSGLVNVLTEEEIVTMIETSEKEGAIENDEKEMIVSVLEFGDLLVREVMIPRIDIVALEVDTPLDKALQTLINSGHSRIPVYEDTIDNIKGLLYAKDLLNLWGKTPRPLKDIMRKANFVPESKQADVLLHELKRDRIHMVIVVDEYGGTAGLITLEDLIEEIIGDIQDEYDIHEEAEFVQEGPDTFTVDAGITLTDFNDLLNVELSKEDSDTLGGFIFTELGHVPEPGETLDYQNLSFTITSLDGRRIRKVSVIRKPVSTPETTRATGEHQAAPDAQPVTDNP
ncbi:MAG TPA: hemolysin family protein [Aggregatilineales bacterium]|nr:hemolysin family protein [Aggregatilineales bacterium]